MMMELRRGTAMISRACILQAGLLFAISLPSFAVEEGSHRMLRDEVRDALAMLEDGSIEKVEEVLGSGTLDQTLGLRAAFWKFPQSDFKVEVLLRFLDQPDRFWVIPPFTPSTRAEIDVADSLRIDVISYLKEHIDIDLVDNELLSLNNAEGREEIVQMIQKRLGRPSPEEEGESSSGGNHEPGISDPPRPKSEDALDGGEPSVSEASDGGNPWPLIALGGLAVLGIAAVLARAKGR